ncbi:hypothetical protein RclHR1_00150002 [Rhizophagus clarus]|uniref:Uncharacterized protein n=1 Tax=Rhizophagus clarus TaxID=94130 RepID=A0A2Z6R6J2_9GLOM|nr:hypothetical protein RclHR1_00150002 [Rhizophagus clarus]
MAKSLTQNIDRYQKMAAYLRTLAISCLFMCQLALRAADHAFRYHLLSSHPDFDSEDDTDTDINIDIMNEFHPVTPMPQQLSSLSQPLPIPDFTIIPSSDTTQMLTEDIPKIVTSFSKITSVPNGSRQFG